MSEHYEGAPRTEPELDRRISVRIGRDRYRTDVAVRGHPLVVDEPESLGGTDHGPTPFDLLCAALGSCTVITLRMYADRKRWPLEEVIATVEHHREKGSGGAGARTSGDIFRMSLELRGPLDAAQRSRLIEIAARCPVHRTLIQGATIETRPA